MNTKHYKALREQNAKLLNILNALLAWEEFMGGFEGPCWQDARAAIAKAKAKGTKS